MVINLEGIAFSPESSENVIIFLMPLISILSYSLVLMPNISLDLQCTFQKKRLMQNYIFCTLYQKKRKTKNKKTLKKVKNTKTKQ